MARQDLLVLTQEDLTALSNAGLVKRAWREIESGELTCELREAEGNVQARWSDGVNCFLPANTVLSKGRCSCPATTLCRHLLRTVLFYQKQLQNLVVSESESSLPPRAWNPGDINDELLLGYYSKSAIARARKLFEEGQVVAVSGGIKPTAHFHTLACTVRFMVEGNPAYAKCDCREEAPCQHVLLAVWAFHLLPAEKQTGLIATRKETPPVPLSLLAELEKRLLELARVGVSNYPPSLMDHFRRLENRCREEGLVWPAEICLELVQQLEQYRAHDARFEAETVARLAGELTIRLAAIRSDSGKVPQLFIRGAKSDGLMEIGSARLVGLGCGVRVGRKGVEISVYLQDQDSGIVMALQSQFANPAEGEPRPFWQLAQLPIARGVLLGTLGAGQLLIKGAKRSAGHQLILGRQPLSANPQTFQWESLRPPLLVEDFSELKARLSSLPPASLRPRHLSETFQVIPLTRAAEAHFSMVDQAVTATLFDREGIPATLVHPYTTRGYDGVEALLKALTERPEELRFVAGQVRMGANGLLISPAALVFEHENKRLMVQPWIDRANQTTQETEVKARLNLSPANDPLTYFPAQVEAALGELYLLGLERTDGSTTRYWQNLYRQGSAWGFSRFMKPVGKLTESLVEKDHLPNWDSSETARLMLEAGLLARLAREYF